MTARGIQAFLSASHGEPSTEFVGLLRAATWTMTYTMVLRALSLDPIDRKHDAP
jgi:hypothetical protein